MFIVDSDYYDLRTDPADHYREPAGHNLSLDALLHYVFPVARL